jgi:hypothetical protein
MFWLVVALEIVTLIPLFGDVQLFVLIVVPTASFFSIGVGTIVYLSSEHDIRRTVRGVASSTLLALEREISSLFDRRSELDQSQWDQLMRLRELHKELASAGRYRGLVLSVLSILAPLVGPAIAVTELLQQAGFP